jgi:predicted nucleic acid-binding protein
LRSFELTTDNSHRRSLRLHDYDYSQNGAYFVTICCQNKASLFGEIINGEVRLNDAGKMVERWWHELANKFPTIELDEFITMPNHFHGIIVIVGADLRVCPDTNQQSTEGKEKQGEHVGSPLQRAALGEIVQWFKTMTTNEYIRGVREKNWESFYKRLWQRNYYEHIIRDAESLDSTRLYIQTNPAQWYARVLKGLTSKGRPIPDNDVWIAATAFQHNLTVLTRDSHFDEVDNLPIESW